MFVSWKKHRDYSQNKRQIFELNLCSDMHLLKDFSKISGCVIYRYLKINYQCGLGLVILSQYLHQS